jgi:hypothetical protein
MKTKNVKPSTPDNDWSGSKYHQASTMPRIGSLEAKSTIKPGSISRAPTPAIHGAGEKRKTKWVAALASEHYMRIA